MHIHMSDICTYVHTYLAGKICNDYISLRTPPHDNNGSSLTSYYIINFFWDVRTYTCARDLSFEGDGALNIWSLCVFVILRRWTTPLIVSQPVMHPVPMHVNEFKFCLTHTFSTTQNYFQQMALAILFV